MMPLPNIELHHLTLTEMDCRTPISTTNKSLLMQTCRWYQGLYINCFTKNVAEPLRSFDGTWKFTCCFEDFGSADNQWLDHNKPAQNVPQLRQT